MGEKIIAIGDLHLNWQATKVALDFARKEGINTAFNLGDEEHEIYPFAVGDSEVHERLFDELRTFIEENPNRRLICVVGDKTAGVPEDLLEHYAGYKTKGSVIFHEGNIIAAHNGKWILDEYGDLITNFADKTQSLIIFHGHSHSMGVLPKYKWLKDHEFVRYIPEGERQYKLKPGKVYWINPGGNSESKNEGKSVANLAVYDLETGIVILKTIPFCKEDIKPTRQIEQK